MAEQGKYFRFLCRAIPGKYAIDPKKRVKDQPVFTEMSKEEMEQYTLPGMPLYFEHVSGIEVGVDAKGAETTDRKKVEYHPDRYALGHVVDKFVTDDGTMLTLCEVQPELDQQSDRGLARHALRTSVINQIQNNALDKVSFTHIIDSQYDKKTDRQVVKKLPMELSLTTNPLREGAAILHHYFSDTPYLSGEEYKNFDIYESAAESLIDYAAVDRNDEVDRQEKEQEEMAAAAGPTKEELAKIMAELEASRKEVALSKLSLQKYEARDKAEDEVKRKAFVDNTVKMRAATMGMIAELLKPENKIAFAPGDKETFEALAKASETKDTAAAQAEPLVLNEQRQKYLEGTEPLDARTLFESFDKMMATMSGEVVACHRAAEYMNKVIEARNRDAGTAARADAKSAAGGKTDASGIASQPQKREIQPELISHWEALQKKTAAMNKAMEVSINDLPK